MAPGMNGWLGEKEARPMPNRVATSHFRFGHSGTFLRHWLFLPLIFASVVSVTGQTSRNATDWPGNRPCHLRMPHLDWPTRDGVMRFPADNRRARAQVPVRPRPCLLRNDGAAGTKRKRRSRTTVHSMLKLIASVLVIRSRRSPGRASTEAKPSHSSMSCRVCVWSSRLLLVVRA